MWSMMWVSRENYDPFAELRALAAETIREVGRLTLPRLQPRTSPRGFGASTGYHHGPEMRCVGDVRAMVRGPCNSRWHRRHGMRSRPRWTLSTGGATCSRSRCHR